IPIGLGPSGAMSALNGTGSQACTSLLFGDGVSCAGTNWGFNGFTDDIHDLETNLEHTLHRKYSSSQGRWLTPDPGGARCIGGGLGAMVFASEDILIAVAIAVRGTAIYEAWKINDLEKEADRVCSTTSGS